MVVADSNSYKINSRFQTPLRQIAKHYMCTGREPIEHFSTVFYMFKTISSNKNLFLIGLVSFCQILFCLPSRDKKVVNFSHKVWWVVGLTFSPNS